MTARGFEEPPHDLRQLDQGRGPRGYRSHALAAAAQSIAGLRRSRGPRPLRIANAKSACSSLRAPTSLAAPVCERSGHNRYAALRGAPSAARHCAARRRRGCVPARHAWGARKRRLGRHARRRRGAQRPHCDVGVVAFRRSAETLIVCVNRSASLYARLTKGERIGVSVLAAGHVRYPDAFAGQHGAQGGRPFPRRPLDDDRRRPSRYSSMRSPRSNARSTDSSSAVRTRS